MTPDDILHLGENGVIVRDGTLGPSVSLEAARTIRRFDDEGGLTPAGVGRDGCYRPDIRGDRTAWHTEATLPTGLLPLWTLFEELRHTLNRDAWLGLRSFELQLASYEGNGSQYARHTDALRGMGSRRITAILYLNPGWEPGHRGRLLAETGRGPLAVEPHLDRLVIFRSAHVPHEVEPVYMRRFAATAWYRSSSIEEW